INFTAHSSGDTHIFFREQRQPKALAKARNPRFCQAREDLLVPGFCGNTETFEKPHFLRRSFSCQSSVNPPPNSPAQPWSTAAISKKFRFPTSRENGLCCFSTRWISLSSAPRRSRSSATL